jgi:CBS domain containing-hemolysin-like protein
MSALLLVVLGLLLFASAFFSGTETAFFALNRLQVRRMERDGGSRARRVLAVLARPQDLLNTVLVGNTLVNIATTVVVTTLMIDRLGRLGVEVAIAVSTVAVLLLGEVTPKTLAMNYPEAASRNLVYPYRLIHALLAPLVSFVSFLAGLVLALLRIKPIATGPGGLFSRSELGSLFEGADEEGVMTARESRLVQRILGLSALTAEEIMTPRVDMVAVPEGIDRARLEEIVIAAKHSRIPVYARTIDEIRGYLKVRDFLLDPDRRMADLVRPVAIFPERAPASRVFYEMQRRRTALAVVVNEYGETTGLLTREDAIEEVVGDIYDEYESVRESLVPMGPGEWLAEGRLRLEELNESLAIDLPRDDAVTLSGFLTGIFGHLPARGETTRWDGIEFTALEVSRHRIQRARVRLPRPAAGEVQA